jgi:hypothetical protein
VLHWQSATDVRYVMLRVDGAKQQVRYELYREEVPRARGSRSIRFVEGSDDIVWARGKISELKIRKSDARVYPPKEARHLYVVGE